MANNLQHWSYWLPSAHHELVTRIEACGYKCLNRGIKVLTGDILLTLKIDSTGAPRNFTDVLDRMRIKPEREIKILDSFCCYRSGSRQVMSGDVRTSGPFTEVDVGLRKIVQHKDLPIEFRHSSLAWQRYLATEKAESAGD